MTIKKPKTRGPHGRLHAFVPIDVLDDAKAMAKRRKVPIDDVVTAGLRLLLIQAEDASGGPGTPGGECEEEGDL